MNAWGGELDYVDDHNFRKESFEAWLSWEFLQRSVSRCSVELTNAGMGQLCGKRRKNIEVIYRRSLSKARNANHV